MMSIILLLFLIVAPISAENNLLYLDTLKAGQNMVLPYKYDALEPVISEQTMCLHHGKHLKAYVDKLAALVVNTPYDHLPLSRMVVLSDSSVFDHEISNNAGQVLNHSLYFTQFASEGGGEPSGLLADAIINQWGSFAEFKDAFNQHAAELFGSGWVWLACDHEGQLYIVQEPNGGNPVTHGLIPLLGIDVWEHAYYLDYQYRRGDHVESVWGIINWPIIENRYESTGVAENSCQTAVERMWEK